MRTLKGVPKMDEEKKEISDEETRKGFLEAMAKMLNDKVNDHRSNFEKYMELKLADKKNKE